MFISAHIVLKQTRYEALSKLCIGITVDADGPRGVSNRLSCENRGPGLAEVG
jgi:hypothetical protein